jgi:hypothetical protein
MSAFGVKRTYLRPDSDRLIRSLFCPDISLFRRKNSLFGFGREFAIFAS